MQEQQETMSKDKKDYTVKKINIERDFADEVFKKYKYDRYGIGSCCTSNFTSKLNTKYICDYQDSEIFTYSEKKVTTSKYIVPSEGAPNDADRPAWVDELCGMANEDVQIYCYYDGSSLGADAVLKAYQSVKEWIDTISGEVQSISGCPTPKALVQDFHTVVAGERWLDWAIQPITGVFNNAGSCGGRDSGCATNTPPVQFGPCVSGTYSDSVIPVTSTTAPFWQTLHLFEQNNLVLYNGGGAGANTTGTYALTNPTIGEPPTATAQNVLVVVFADESAQGSPDGSVAQPYHNRSSIVPPTAMTWAHATIGTGTAADGSDATLTPCWKADHEAYKVLRNAYLFQNPTHKYSCFLYPSRPSNVSDIHRPFVLHALGAISSGNKPDNAATATITFTGNPTNTQAIQIVATSGLTKTYTAGATTSTALNQFASTGTVADVAAALKLCIEDTFGHNGTITVTNGSTPGQLILTQAVVGGLGNTTITSTLANTTVVSFTGGTPDGTFVLNNTLPNNGAPQSSLSNLENITLGNPYYSQGYGALDTLGWGIDPAMVAFEPSQFENALNNFVDISTCQDTECLLFVIRDQNGNPVEDFEIIWNGGVVGETDEQGLFRYCVPNASIDTNHIFDLCHCITTTGNCNSQKISVTVTDDTCVEECPDRPYENCYIPPSISSGNQALGCIDPAACNFNPLAVTDDGSCTYCCTFFASLDSKTDAASGVDNGAISISVGGGIGPYTFQWYKDGVAYATTQNLTGLGGGIYSVVVTDSSTNPPCITQLVVTIDQPPVVIFGCTNNLACNYNAAANQDDGSCLFKGCTDSTATNYDPAATADCNCNPPTSSLYQNATGWDSCCIPCVFGCMDPNANNYGPQATCDDGSCTYNYSCVEVPGSGNIVTYINSSLSEFPNQKGINPCIMDANGEQAAYYDGSSDKCAAAVSVGTGPFDSANHMMEFMTSIPSWNSIPGVNPAMSAGTDITQYLLPYDLNAGYNPDCPFCTEPLTPPGVAQTVAVNPLKITWNFLYNWAILIPNSTQVTSTNYAYKEYTDLAELYDDINILLANNTIALNDASGNPISSVGGWTAAGATTPDTLTITQINDAFLLAPYGWSPSSGVELKPNITMDFVICQCKIQPNTECECQEMTDGTGIYPTLIDCTSSLTCCNTNPPDLPYKCTYSSISDSCANLIVMNQGQVSFNADQQAVNFWTSPNSAYLNINPIDNYKYQLFGSGSCEAPFNSHWKRFNFIEVSYQGTTINGLGIGSWSWNDVISFFVGLGLNGTTVDPVLNTVVPDISGGVNYSQLKNLCQQLGAPGSLLNGYDIHFGVSECICEYEDCLCIPDATGTYATLADCNANCCGDSDAENVDLPGCTQESAVNYNPGATVDDGSCYVCDPAPPEFQVVGSVGVISIQTDTNGTTDPSAYDVADGTIIVNPTTFINNIAIGGNLQQYVASLYSASYTAENGTAIIDNQVFQDSIIFDNLAADVYTIVFSHQQYPQCVSAVQVTLADATPQVLYKCIPGDLSDDTSEKIFINALHNTLQNPISSFTNDAALIKEVTTRLVNMYLGNLWGFVAGSTDVSKCYSALWGGTKKHIDKVQARKGDVIIYENDLEGIPNGLSTWLGVKKEIIDIVNAANLSTTFLNDASIWTMSLTQLNAYLAAKSTGVVVSIILKDATCSVTPTQCVPAQDGIYTSQDSCFANATCPSALTGTNSGCSLSASANTTNVVTGSNAVAGNSTPYTNQDNCLWCSNFNTNVQAFDAINADGMSQTGSINVSAVYAPINASLQPDIQMVLVSVVAGANGNFIVSENFNQEDKLYPGNYYLMVVDNANFLQGGTSSTPVCTNIFPISIGGPADAKLDSSGNPTVVWGTDLSDPYSYIPDSAITLDDTINTISVNLNPANGTYTVNILDGATGATIANQTGVTQFTSNSLPAGGYKLTITIDAGNPLAGGKAVKSNIIFT